MLQLVRDFPTKKSRCTSTVQRLSEFTFVDYSWLLYSSTISSTLVSRGLPGRQASA